MSARIRRFSEFLIRVSKSKRVLAAATVPELEILTEIVYNLLNNDRLFITRQERQILEPIVPQLYTISRIRQPEPVRRQLSQLSSVQLRTLVHIAFSVAKLVPSRRK